MTNEFNPEQTLTNAIRHIRRTHMNTRTWTLTAPDEQAIAILNDSRFWAGRFQKPEVSPFDEMAAYQPGRGVHGNQE